MNLSILNPFDLSGRTILVTGASSGIGRETAVLLSELGAKLILVARRKKELVKTRDLLMGGGHLIEVFDLIDYDAVSGWLKNLSQKNGILNGLVHCAGARIMQSIRYVSSSDIEKMFLINVTAAIALVKAFRQKGVCQCNSSIVFISSVAGLTGLAGISAYSASKGAIISLTRSAAIELARDKIRVNCIAPGYIQTEMLETEKLSNEQKQRYINNSPLGAGTSRDVACAAGFLLADAARWITGTTLVVDGGYSNTRE
ncbi:MAG TPA: oxidoreductase [Coxiellaceae bacterium]|nr:oxidoreductase [Coxiellaceae bacterium]